MRRTVIENTAFGPTPYSKSDDLIEKAWEASSPAQQIKFALKALVADLDSIDGYILLSHNVDTLAEKLALLREAVHVGDRLWQPYFNSDEMAWWGFIGTRPYMRAMHELGLALMQAGDARDAEACFLRLLELNRNDNQGVRELLVHLQLMDGRYEDASKVLSDYPDDFLIGMNIYRLACALHQGDTDIAKSLGEIVANANEFMLPVLAAALRKNKPPINIYSDYVTLGSKEEALSYLEFSWDYWNKPNPKSAFLALFGGPDKPAKISASKSATASKGKKA